MKQSDQDTHQGSTVILSKAEYDAKILKFHTISDDEKRDLYSKYFKEAYSFVSTHCYEDMKKYIMLFEEFISDKNIKCVEEEGQVRINQMGIFLYI